jgi:hypothetical protein
LQQPSDPEYRSQALLVTILGHYFGQIDLLPW